MKVYDNEENGKVLEEYARVVNRLLAPATDLTCCILGMVGEAGEVADEYKKQVYNGWPSNLQKLDTEVGDLLFYIQAYCVLRGVEMADLMCENMYKLNKRYPNGFVPGGGERSHER